MSNEIKIESGEKRKFSTGATKQATSGKGRPSLVPGDAILEVSKHFEEGILIHGERNWEKGIPLSVWLDSLERHLQQLKMGMTDEPHARALVWNALVYLATKLRIENGLLPASLNDMPAYRLEQEVILGKTVEEAIVDTMKSIAFNDGQWYCSDLGCFERGFSNVASNVFYCDKHKKGN